MDKIEYTNTLNEIQLLNQKYDNIQIDLAHICSDIYKIKNILKNCQDSLNSNNFYDL